ncbi:MAG: hypothetical protein QM479_07915 [Pseudomonadota bacterium]
MEYSSEKIAEIERSLRVEGEGLAAISESGILANMLDDYEDYESFIKARCKSLNSKKLVKKISNGTNIIDGTKQSNELKKIFYYAHLTACCELFNGWELPINTLNRQNMDTLLNQSLSQLNGASEEKLQELESRIQRADAIKSIQILRMMGLLSSSSSNQRQFSIAAGNASREIDGVHMIPKISRRLNVLDNNKNIFVIKKLINQPESIVLIDNDPAFKGLYQSFNQNKSDWILAFNEDADLAVKKLSAMIEDKNWQPCNLVAGIRIDHEIIPDVSKFFRQLMPVLDTVSDFIITVGAGHSVDEFEGRINLMTALFEYLSKQGLEPVKIILHGGGSIEEQRNTPLFGTGPTTTYEILYCKIKKKKLL